MQIYQKFTDLYAIVVDYDLNAATTRRLYDIVWNKMDIAENMILRHIPFAMQVWESRLNSFIQMFEYGLLQDTRKVSVEIAKLHVETEFKNIV